MLISKETGKEIEAPGPQMVFFRAAQVKCRGRSSAPAEGTSKNHVNSRFPIKLVVMDWMLFLQNSYGEPPPHPRPSVMILVGGASEEVIQVSWGHVGATLKMGLVPL